MRVVVAVPPRARALVWVLPAAGFMPGLLGPARNVYRPDPQGYMLVRPDHVPELLRQGCTLVHALRGG